jgi:phosphoglycolate phosphatase/putative hydrolase of the HAD superfamily
LNVLASDGSFRVSAAPVAATSRPLRNPLHGGWICAVLFDLDGTLYHQRPLRALMALELLTLPLTSPSTALLKWRRLAAYRRAQESLRGQLTAVTSDAQLRAAATRAACEVEAIELLVTEWMFRRPLKYLRVCRASGIVELLEFLSRRGLRSGLLSDYPAHDKLAALGLAGCFDPILSATDPSIHALKPHPRGFLEAAHLWQLDAREVLVVGDRADVDAEGAAAAGMPCVIVGRPHRASHANGYKSIGSLKGLHRVLSDGSR